MVELRGFPDNRVPQCKRLAAQTEEPHSDFIFFSAINHSFAVYCNFLDLVLLFFTYSVHCYLTTWPGGKFFWGGDQRR